MILGLIRREEKDDENGGDLLVQLYEKMTHVDLGLSAQPHQQQSSDRVDCRSYIGRRLLCTWEKVS